MSKVKTEWATLEQHDNAARNAIERKAYTFYECDDFKDGRDQEHWFRAERELTIQDVPFSIENDVVTVRIAMECFPASTLIISISACSVLIFRLDEVTDRECLRIISLPVEIDAAQATSVLNGNDFALRLPLLAGALTLSEATCV